MITTYSIGILEWETYAKDRKVFNEEKKTLVLDCKVEVKERHKMYQRF